MPSLFPVPRFFRLTLLWACLGLSALLLLVRTNAFWNALSPVTHKDLLYELAGRYKVDPLLLAAIESSESAFNFAAESKAGARGLMQLLPSTAEEEAAALKLDYQDAEDLYQPEINLRLGTHHFVRLLKAFDGNVVLALAAYNAGSANVRGWKLQSFGREQEDLLEDIPVKETRRYVRRVLSAYRRFKTVQKFKRALQGLK